MHLLRIFVHKFAIACNTPLNLTLYVVTPRDNLVVGVIVELGSRAGRNKFREQLTLVFLLKFFCLCHFRAADILGILWSMIGVGFSRSTLLISFFHIGFKLAFLPAIFENHPRELKDKHSHPGTFSHSSSNKTSSNVRSHYIPAEGCPYNILSNGTTGSGILSMIWSTENVVGVSESLGIQLPAISTILEHLPFLLGVCDHSVLASPAHPGTTIRLARCTSGVSCPNSECLR